MAKKPSRAGAPALFPDLDPSPVVPMPRRARVASFPSSMAPLFLPGLVDLAVSAVESATFRESQEAAHSIFKKWAGDLRAGVLDAQNETQLEADFYKGLLHALGFRTSSDVPTGSPWTMQPKLHLTGVGTPDVALGRFWSGEGGLGSEPLVVVEVEATNKDLDRRESSSGRSPVQQAWDYLNGSESARWAIVSNYVEIRLYSKQRTSRHVHRVALDDLDDPAAFAEFFAVFQADRLLGTGNLAWNADKLLKETVDKQEKVSEDLYAEYADRRVELIREIRAQRPEVSLDRAIEAAQMLLDRVLFIAFAEDRDLLPGGKMLEEAAAVKVPGLSRWRAFQLLFRAIDEGDPLNEVPKYNGSLFKPDPILDDPKFALDGAKWSTVFKGIGSYDFRSEVTVDVLGRIFERSINDIEEIKEKSLEAHEAELVERRKKKKKTSGERHRQGVYYTDAAVVDYLVDAALRPAWEDERFRQIESLGLGPELPEPPPGGFSRGMLAWLDGLAVCDPACGSGAFLNGAYSWLEDARIATLKDLRDAVPDAAECAGIEDDWRARSAASILKNNLFGVDLSAESVEIARLSLWLRTARRGLPLTDLSTNILRGNSVVSDPSVDPLAFDWPARFPGPTARGGFDAIVGNPPYVRQERLGAIKPHLEASYRAYHGMADLYVYFYERGLSLLRPGGRLAFVVTNKWMKAGYGEPLRRLFAEGSWVESVVDFGHAKKFFKDADVFPCFLVARRPDDGPAPETSRACVLPREAVDLKELKKQIGEGGSIVPRSRLGADAWNLEPAAVSDLLAKIRDRGIPLAEFAGTKPYYGVKTGFNEAFLIDTPTRDALVLADPRSAEILKPYLRGQDIDRWSPEWAGLWMIFTRRGIDIDAYPGVKRHLLKFRDRLEPKPSDWTGEHWTGRKPGNYRWYEIQDSVEYWTKFDEPKIYYQVIQYYPSYGWDEAGRYGNDKTFFLPAADFYLLAVLNSPLMWWHNWRFLTHLKDEALSPMGYMVETLPIARPSDADRESIQGLSNHLIKIARSQQTSRRVLLDWLKAEFDVEKPGDRLGDPAALDLKAFQDEVRARRGAKTVSAAAIQELTREYHETVGPMRERAAEASRLESALSDLVNAAYGLTPDEVRLMWDTAPPRMPIPRPPGV